MLMWSTLALSILGAVMVFSASSIYSLENKGNSFSIIGRQLFFLVIAIPI
jgi:cell division protein FtsW